MMFQKVLNSRDTLAKLLQSSMWIGCIYNVNLKCNQNINIIYKWKIPLEFISIRADKRTETIIPSSDDVLELEFTVINLPSFVLVISKQKRESFSVSIMTSSPECDPSLVHDTLV